MSKIEEVARALYETKTHRRHTGWAELHPNYRRFWEKRAIAAIRALREPDEGMLEAMEKEAGHSLYRWTAAVDSILSEAGEKP